MKNTFETICKKYYSTPVLKKCTPKISNPTIQIPTYPIIDIDTELEIQGAASYLKQRDIKN